MDNVKKLKINEKLFVALKMITFFMMIVTICFLMLALTYLLPKENIKDNVYSSVKTLKKEGSHYKSFFDNNNYISKSMQLDNFTDAIILNIAVENSNNENIIQKAVLNERYYDGKGPLTSLENKYVQNEKSNWNYTRYWFGTLVILKPLLTVFTYQSIRYINIIFIFSAFVIATMLVNNKLNFKYAISYFLSILLCGLYIVPVSLQYTPVFAITFATSILILIFYEKDRFKKFIPYLFILIGSLTAYFDLLTTPLLTFGFPIILLILLRNKNEQHNFKENFIYVVKLGLIWAISYAMMYFFKWVIASAVLGRNEIATAWKQFTFRANMEDSNKFNRIDAIQKNFNLYFNKFVILGLFTFLVIYLLIIIKKKYYKNINYRNISILAIIRNITIFLVYSTK